MMQMGDQRAGTDRRKKDPGNAAPIATRSLRTPGITRPVKAVKRERAKLWLKW
jgi:hypothetical protein